MANYVCMYVCMLIDVENFVKEKKNQNWKPFIPANNQHIYGFDLIDFNCSIS